MADRIQLRRDTAANWTAYNPILLEGEPGIELDTDQWKLGDGIHTWSQLAYRGGECVQQKGQSTTVAMSQKAVTDELNNMIEYINDLYIDTENSSNSEYWSLIKEIYITNENFADATYIKLKNVARNVRGFWYVRFEVSKDGNTSTYYINLQSEPDGLQEISNFGYIVLDWNGIPNNVQVSTNIIFNDKIFDISFSPTISSFLKNQRINNVIRLGGYYEIGGRYVHTSSTTGVPSISVGDGIIIRAASSFHITRFRVSAGQKLYIPYTLNTNVINPVVVNDNDIVLQVGNQSIVNRSTNVVINSIEYWKFEVERDGILVYSKSKGNSKVILAADDEACFRNDVVYEYVKINDSGAWLNFVKECHVKGTKDQFPNLRIANIARGVNGNWCILFEWGEEGNKITSSFYVHSEQEVVKIYYQGIFIIYAIVNWAVFPSGIQENTNICISDKAFENSEIFRITDEIDEVKSAISGINVPFLKNLVFESTGKLSGYVNTSDTDGTPYGTIGMVISYNGIGSSWYHVRIPIHKNETVYVPYITGNYTIKNPIVVDELDTLLQIGNQTEVDTSTLITFNAAGDGDVPYWAFTSEYEGYLIFSRNKDFGIFSDKPSTRPSRSKEEIKQSLTQLLGEVQIILGTESTVPFNFEVAKNMNHTMLKSLIETASNGSCTVLYDTNGYPNLMFKIPLMTIGVLAPTLGDMETPHPAFVVNGTTKRHIYAAVFMNSEYNGVPVSWFGLGTNMRSKSFLECRTLCAAKGTGWHLETIWERSLISLLSAKYHDNRPRGNNCWGRSCATGFEYECVERVDGRYPGSHQNGCQWYDGTQPNTWSHNNSRWGIFDIIGGYHEWCNLAKVVDGQIFLAADNKYNAEESEWVATGAYIGFDNDKVKYSNVQYPVVELKTGAWSDALCDSGYDSLSLDIRKKLALSLMCPRLSSEDTQPVFDFNGRIWVRRNDEEGYTTYPFLGGATEYADCGLGFNILSYVGTEAHNNMGSRLFYID